MPMRRWSEREVIDALTPRVKLKVIDVEAEVALAKQRGLKRWLLDKLTEAFDEARRGKLKTSDENSFEVNWIENIVNLRDAIIERRYEPGASVAFVIFEPMVREIFASQFKDRVVHHFLYDMQAEWWDRRFINESFSCRVNKGTLAAIKCAQRHMRQVSHNGKRDAMVFKGDISGYFMSLPRAKLYERVKWGLDKQFAEVMNDPIGYQIYDICRFLWEMVLFDNPTDKSWKRGDRKNWDPKVLPPKKSLYCQPPGYGIVIGNLTSQLVSNIYLDQLDRYLRYTLGYVYTARYVDDFYIMVDRRDWKRLSRDIPKIEAFLRDELGLTLHPQKRYIQNVSKGMNFVGARVHLNCIYPSNRIQSHFPKALEKLICEDGDLEPVISYMGMMKHFDSYKYVKKVMEKFDM